MAEFDVGYKKTTRSSSSGGQDNPPVRYGCVCIILAAFGVLTLIASLV